MENTKTMKRPLQSEWVIQEGEETEEMPVGEFLPIAFSEAQERYIGYLEEINTELLKALEYYEEGINHFYSKIDFGSSFLDAAAIEFMNESNLKIKKAINKAKGVES